RTANVHRIAIGGLDVHEMADFLRAAAGHELESTGLELAEMWRADTAGNPFFTGEVLRHMASTGTLERSEDGRWSIAVDVASVEIPPTVPDVVRPRLPARGP